MLQLGPVQGLGMVAFIRRVYSSGYRQRRLGTAWVLGAECADWRQGVLQVGLGMDMGPNPKTLGGCLKIGRAHV